MSAARVIDLQAVRAQREQRQKQQAAAPRYLWVPMYFWVPVLRPAWG